MPELPEVETIRRQLHEALKGFRIQSVDIWKSGREKPVGSRLVKMLEGKKVVGIHRRAKLLIWELSGGIDLLAHLKMTGRFVFVETPYIPQKHDRIRFEFEDSLGEKKFLVWSDVRTFGYVHAIQHEELEGMVSRYGLEPLEHTAAQLALRFARSTTRSIKQCLLDQTIIAGIGNIYADEACFRAGILPMRSLKMVTKEERIRLMECVQEVLRASLAQRGTSANDYVDSAGERGGFLSLLQVYGRAGELCVRCKMPIQKQMLNQRGTHWCASCQK